MIPTAAASERVRDGKIPLAGFPGHDKQKLMALIQSSDKSESEDDDLDVNAPAGDVYKTHSTGIFDLLEDLKEKAEEELASLRKAETNTQHNFAMLKQSLEDQMEVDDKQLGEAKTAKHDAFETKATAEGDLSVAKQDLSDSESVLKSMKGDCAARAADHETSVANRADELKAIAAAKQAIMEMTGGAQGIVYNSASFLQLQVSGVVDVDPSRFGVSSMMARTGKFDGSFIGSTVMCTPSKICGVRVY